MSSLFENPLNSVYGISSMPPSQLPQRMQDYPYTFNSDFTLLPTARVEKGLINPLNNVIAVRVEEISIESSQFITAQQMYLQFAPQQSNIVPSDRNPARASVFAFTTDQISPNTVRWQATNDRHGLIQVADGNLIRLTNIEFEVRRQATEQPFQYGRVVVRFVITTLGSGIGYQNTPMPLGITPQSAAIYMTGTSIPDSF